VTNLRANSIFAPAQADESLADVRVSVWVAPTANPIERRAPVCESRIIATAARRLRAHGTGLHAVRMFGVKACDDEGSRCTA
jgi:hypothetical protein